MDVDYDQPTYPDTPALAFAASGSARTSAATIASTGPATSSVIRPRRALWSTPVATRRGGRAAARIAWRYRLAPAGAGPGVRPGGEGRNDVRDRHRRGGSPRMTV